jgi:hypothetical protein
MDRKLQRGRFGISVLLTIALSVPLRLAAQVPVAENGSPLAAYDDGEYASKGIAGAQVEDVIWLSGTELEDLVGPVALYPDDLLAIVLPASTYPLEIVQAARFLDELEADSSLEPDEAWDDSVVALLNYPEVIRMLDEDIDWTWRLGEAVISQQAEVIAAIESFRDRAYAAGNLASDEYQTVKNNDGVIKIAPVNEEIIYVPYYEPEEVIVYQPETVYAYYPEPRPVYYYPYPVAYDFPSQHFWGVTTAFTIGWPHGNLNVYHPTYWGHPYYNRFYYGHYYRQPSINVYNTWYVNNNYRRSDHQHRDGDHWQPRHRSSGARPVNRTAANRRDPSGDGDRSRVDARSDRRTRTDTQQAERNPGQRDRTQASAGNRPATTDAASNGQRSTAAAGTRQGSRDGNRGSRAVAAREIRFRERAARDTLQANQSSDSPRHARTGSNRRQSAAANAGTATSYRNTSSGSDNGRRAVPAVQRSATAATPQSRATRTPAAARTVSGPTVQQRPEQAQRTASRPVSARPAAARQAGPRASREPAAAPRVESNRGQQAARQNAAPAGRDPAAAKPARQQSSSGSGQRAPRGNQRQRPNQ